MDIRRLFVPTSSRVLVAVALFASSALLFLVLGHWVVQLAAPRIASRPPLTLPTPTDAAQAIVSRHLFGIADKPLAGAAGAAFAPLGVVRVLGVASSGRAGEGFAIVSINGQAPVPAIEGREFAPGARLTKVTASGIEYEFGGVLQRAALQEKSPARPVGASDGRAGAPMPGQFSSPAARN